jgi:hypothetical protein
LAEGEIVGDDLWMNGHGLYSITFISNLDVSSNGRGQTSTTVWRWLTFKFPRPSGCGWSNIEV